MNNKVYVPSKGVNSWRDLLANPVKQWKLGCSAMSLADAWEKQSGFPESFIEPLKSVGLDLELLLAIPEHKVYLDTKKAPSQNDLFTLSKDKEGLVSMTVEGKVSEPFGMLVKPWSDDSESRTSRLKFLIAKLELGLPISSIGDFRYQLFHRTVSSILEAERFTAKKAVMIVHSFSDTNKWFDDYSDFVKLINPSITPKLNTIYYCKTLSSGIDLYIGWIKG